MNRLRSSSIPSSALLALAASFAVMSLSACSGNPDPTPKVADIPKTAAPPQALACASGTADCDHDRGNACEAALDTSASHCGACGNTCAGGEACVSGSCKRVTALSAADDHACAVLSSGEVRCWGDNSEGTLGDGTKEMRTTPTPVKELADAVSIRASADLGCAVLKNGKLFCWGSGKSGVVPFIEGVVDVAIRRRMFCAALKTGEVRCAEPSSGSSDSLSPEPSPDIRDAIAVAAGDDHACALRKTGEVVCWGDPEVTGSGVKKEEQKIGEEEDSEAREKRAVAVKGITDAVQISSLRSHTCAVLKTGKVACWGSNWSGELGDGTSDDRYGPVEVQFIADAIEVAAGQRHTCVLRKSGEVACWGTGNYGQLGGGVRESSRGPVPVKEINDATHVAAGENFSCATRKSGEISCWGSAERGRLGNGTKIEVSEPFVVPGVEGATEIAVGRAHSCALTSKGVMCWGRGSDAGYGEGMRDRGLPAMVVPDLTDVASIRSGDRNVCAIKKSGDAACFRGGLPRYIDNEKDNAPSRPITVKGLSAVKTLIDTNNTSLVLSKSGQVALWSLERSAYSDKPPGAADTMTIAGLADAVEVTGDDDFGCALRRSGKVSCLRFSAYHTFDKKKPVKPTSLTDIPGLTDVAHISSFNGDFCASRTSGEVTCFSAYALPRPDAKPDPKKKKEEIKLRPVADVKDATVIAVGGSFRCAILKSGEVWCWGSNGRGELGRGDVASHFEPAIVKGLSDATAIAASSTHACAIRKSGAVVCWGSNEEDQVGYKDISSTPLPVAVSGLPSK